MGARTGRRLGRAAAALLVTCGLVVLGATAAAAHATLTGATPAQGSRVETAPASVTLAFTENVGLSSRSVEVLDENGRRVDTGSPAHPGGDGKQVSVGLEKGMARGTYTVVWRVVSADSHPVAGTYSFGLGVNPGAATVRDVKSSPDVVAVHGVARGLALASAAGLVGGVVFCLLVWPAGLRSPRVERVVRVSWWTASGTALALFVVQGPYGAGLNLGYLLSPELLTATASSRFGQLLLLRVVLLAVAVPVLRRLADDDRTAVAPLAGLGALLLLTFSLGEHSGQGRYVVAAAIADLLHAAAACVWLGGLAVLLVAVLAPRGTRPGGGAAGPRPDPATVLPRWSRTATAAVAVLVVTGTVQAWREVGYTDALTGTRYGLVLVAKVGVVALMLLVASTARLLVRRVISGGGTTTGTTPGAGTTGTTSTATATVIADPVTTSLARLRGRVLTEAVLGVVVLVLTAALVNTAPGRDVYDAPFSANVKAVDTEGEQATFLVTLDSTRTGLTAMHVYTYTSYGDQLPFVAATATLRQKEKGLGPIRISLPAVAPGHGTADAVLIPAPGTWTITVQAITDETTAYSASTTYEVRG